MRNDKWRLSVHEKSEIYVINIDIAILKPVPTTVGVK